MKLKNEVQHITCKNEIKRVGITSKEIMTPQTPAFLIGLQQAFKDTTHKFDIDVQNLKQQFLHNSKVDENLEFQYIAKQVLATVNHICSQFQLSINKYYKEISQLQSEIDALCIKKARLEEKIGIFGLPSQDVDYEALILKVQATSSEMKEIYSALNALRLSEEFWFDFSSSPDHRYSNQLVQTLLKHLALKGRKIASIEASAVEITCGRELTARLLTTSRLTFLEPNSCKYGVKDVKIDNKKFTIGVDVFHVTAFADGRFLKLDFASETESHGILVPPEQQEGSGWEAKQQKANEEIYNPFVINQPEMTKENDRSEDIYIAGQDALIRGEIKLSYILDAWADFIAAVREMPEMYEQRSKVQGKEVRKTILIQSKIRKTILQYFGDGIYPTQKYFQMYKSLALECLKLHSMELVQLELDKQEYDFEFLKTMPICYLYHGVFKLDVILKHILTVIEPHAIAQQSVVSEIAQLKVLNITLNRVKSELNQIQIQAKQILELNNQIEQGKNQLMAEMERQGEEIRNMRQQQFNQATAELQEENQLSKVYIGSLCDSPFNIVFVRVDENYDIICDYLAVGGSRSELEQYLGTPSNFSKVKSYRSRFQNCKSNSIQVVAVPISQNIREDDCESALLTFDPNEKGYHQMILAVFTFASFINKPQQLIDKFSQYSIEEFLGCGTFGKVNKVKCKLSQQYYALKQISIKKFSSLSGLSEEESRNKIITEVCLQQQINSPNVIKIKEYFETNCIMYVVMELATQQTLKTYIDSKQDNISFAEFINLGLQLSKAIMATHEKRIIHRDLKPENLVFCSNGMLKLIDFGLARQANAAESVLGSPMYIAPEIISYPVTNKPYTNACDIFSLAGIFYFMLTRKNIFSTIKGRDDLFKEIVQYDTENILLLTVPKEFSGVLHRMFQKDPNKRPTIAQIVEVLEHMKSNIEYIGIQ